MDLLSPYQKLFLGLLLVCVIIFGFTDTGRNGHRILAAMSTDWKEPAKEVVRDKSVETKQGSYKPLLQNSGPVVSEAERVQYPGELWHGYQLPVLVSYPRGRLGNVMGEYATLYAMKYIYNATVFTIDEMRDTLSMFAGLSLPPLPAFPFEIQLFDKFKEEIRREFTFAPSIQEEARKILTTVITKWQHERMRNITPVLVGFHVRRTDYAQHLRRRSGGELPDDTYYLRAIEYYREKFSHEVAFVAASDDMEYIQKHLGHHPDVYFAPGKLREVDMAVLSSCNNSIVTVGSFGFWTGYLTGGEVVYPDLNLKAGYRFSRKTYEKAGLDNFTPLPID